MATDEKQETLRVHVVTREVSGDQPLLMIYSDYGLAVEEAKEGDKIYSGNVALQGKLRRVVQ